ncbi:MAG: tol-pal system protein YbgF [Candidatus Binatia bacterium]
MLEPQSTSALRARSQLSRPLGAVLAFAFAVAGCTPRADYERLKSEVEEMRAHMADTQVSVDALKRQVDRLQQPAVNGRQRVLDERTLALERKVQELEARLATNPTPAPGYIGGEGLPTPTPLPRVPGSAAAPLAMARELQSSVLPEAYRRALELFRDGQTPQAIQAFRDFLRANPKSPLAGNAQYWIGEGYFAQGDYNRAVIELNEVLVKYPQSDRIPAVLLALASAFQKQGDNLDAKLVLQKLISEHPKSEEAQLARQQLPALSD